jgi:hypothetical protein
VVVAVAEISWKAALVLIDIIEKMPVETTVGEMRDVMDKSPAMQFGSTEVGKAAQSLRNMLRWLGTGHQNTILYFENDGSVRELRLIGNETDALDALIKKARTV